MNEDNKVYSFGKMRFGHQYDGISMMPTVAFLIKADDIAIGEIEINIEHLKSFGRDGLVAVCRIINYVTSNEGILIPEDD